MTAYDRPPPWRLTAEMVEAFMAKLKPRPAPAAAPAIAPPEPVEKPERDRMGEAFGAEPAPGDAEDLGPAVAWPPRGMR